MISSRIICRDIDAHRQPIINCSYDAKIIFVKHLPPVRPKSVLKLKILRIC